jgi:hypothetical protein
MNDKIRELFEKVTAPSFGLSVLSFDGSKEIYPRLPNGEYSNPTVEDHWQTFQEGFECAVKECIPIAIEQAEYCQLKMMPYSVMECKIKEHFGVKL